MSVAYRPFQTVLDANIYQAWSEGFTNVMPVAATGSGKTVVISKIITNESGCSMAVAHRQELISQISIAIARNGLRHKIITSNKVLLRAIGGLHTFELGDSYIEPNARVAVGGVDTLLKMGDSEPFFKQTKLLVIDEGHHILKSNKWGKVAAYFPNARGLFPTATPKRADGKGLGRHADGIVDKLVLAPTMRQIIDMGYLTDYRIHVPPQKIDRSKIAISGTTGDFNEHAANAATRDASITGDIVDQYLKIAKGKLGITFTFDIAEAVKIAADFRAKGVPAEVVTAKTPDSLRYEILRKFKNRELLQLVNVDLFGEGFDLPAIEVVSFGRLTESFSLFCQQFGRVLRLLIPECYREFYDNYDDATRKAIIASSSKPFGIVIDHVGNVFRHGLPDKYMDWSLDRRDSKASSASTAIPLRVCAGTIERKGCGLAYERIFTTCPYCGTPVPPPKEGAGMEYVDGDLTELSPEYLAQLRGEIDKPPTFPHNASPEIIGSIRKKHHQRREAREELCNAIAWFAGYQATNGYSESQSYRLFYFKYGIDVATCQTLPRKEMDDLSNRIIKDLATVGINANVDAVAYLSGVM